MGPVAAAGGSGWRAPAAAALLVTGRAASSKPGDGSSQRGEWTPALTREHGLFFTAPNNPDLLCALPVTERKETVISPDTMTAAPRLLERVPFCSAYMGQSPASLGRKRGDFASLPHDNLPTARHSSAQSLCPWEPARQAPVPNHSQRKAPHGWKAGPRHSGPGPRAQGAGRPAPLGKVLLQRPFGVKDLVSCQSVMGC